MDRKFIEAIYIEHYNFVVNTVKCTIYSHNLDDIYSIAQDVFLAAMNTENIENHQNIQGWLFVTAKNKSKQWIDAQAKLAKPAEEGESVENLFRDKDFSDDLLEKAMFKDLMDKNIIGKVMANLTHSEKILYEYRYKQRLTYNELEQIYKVSQGNIRTRISRLKTKIINILQNECNKL